MKKILIAAFALTLLSANSFATGGKKKAKAKKANTAACCTKVCTPKDCSTTANCPVIPGCCKQ